MRGGHLNPRSREVAPGQSSSSQDWLPGNSGQSNGSIQQALLKETRFCLRNTFISYNKVGGDRYTDHGADLSSLKWGKKIPE